MSEKYKIHDKEKAYYVTLTIIDWIDVFTRKNHKLAIINSLKYCQENKGLEIYAYCLMSNHLHMIVRGNEGFDLSGILRDFKKFTSKKIVGQIEDEPESRRKWMLERFERAGKNLRRIKKYKVWQDGNRPMELFSNKFIKQKLDYTHNNPVCELIVEKPEDYMFSSARNYAGLDSYLEIIRL